VTEPKGNANIGPIQRVLGAGRQAITVEVPTSLIGSPGQSIAVFAFLKVSADKDKPLPKGAAIAKATGLSESAVNRATKWLREEGYLA